MKITQVSRPERFALYLERAYSERILAELEGLPGANAFIQDAIRFPARILNLDKPLSAEFKQFLEDQGAIVLSQSPDTAFLADPETEEGIAFLKHYGCLDGEFLREPIRATQL